MNQTRSLNERLLQLPIPACERARAARHYAAAERFVDAVAAAAAWLSRAVARKAPRALTPAH